MSLLFPSSSLLSAGIKGNVEFLCDLPERELNDKTALQSPYPGRLFIYYHALPCLSTSSSSSSRTIEQRLARSYLPPGRGLSAIPGHRSYFARRARNGWLRARCASDSSRLRSLLRDGQGCLGCPVRIQDPPVS
jgi:hypothetical protein